MNADFILQFKNELAQLPLQAYNERFSKLFESLKLQMKMNVEQKLNQGGFLIPDVSIPVKEQSLIIQFNSQKNAYMLLEQLEQKLAVASTEADKQTIKKQIERQRESISTQKLSKYDYEQMQKWVIQQEKSLNNFIFFTEQYLDIDLEDVRPEEPQPTPKQNLNAAVEDLMKMELKLKPTMKSSELNPGQVQPKLFLPKTWAVMEDAVEYIKVIEE
ncbi:Hypothetical_protein [Hexamita inflata]|uniref:Hypothetical_protein n=1 Tax=Hexamita inflata TaxID=28002 RepID=A0AA86PDW3_9EUKA|nr:Hypothetical protein HINF_LOCUS24950 [Hexamita inflata]